jgi:hypothetical protein
MHQIPAESRLYGLHGGRAGLEIEAAGDPAGNRRQRRRNPMFAHQPGFNPHSAPRMRGGEFEVVWPSAGCLRTSEAGVLAHSIGYDACTGTLRRAPDQGIVGIEDGCPFRWQAFHKLAFLESRSLASPECGVVVVANRRHHADLRVQQPKRLRQGSWTPRSDLTNAEPRLWTHLLEHVAQSAWNPSRAVLAGTGPLQNRRRQVPCGCLAATAGDG